MIHLKKPTAEQISEFLEQQRDSKFLFSPIKGTLLWQSKEGFLSDEINFKSFDIDHHRLKIGQGQNAFRKAVDGLKSWKEFNLDWVELHYPDTPISVGANVAILVKSLGIWTLSGCRITYVIDDEGNDPTQMSSQINQSVPGIKRFGFAYGTLETHVARGEERFLVEWNTNTDEVFFDILAFSSPQSWFTKIGYPLARYFQDCFASASLEALSSWVNSTETHSDSHGRVEVQIV